MQGGDCDVARASLLGFSCPQKETVEKYQTSVARDTTLVPLGRQNTRLEWGEHWEKLSWGTWEKKFFFLLTALLHLFPTALMTWTLRLVAEKCKAIWGGENSDI